MSASSVCRRLLHRGLPARDTLTANHRHCVCNWLMSTDSGKQIGIKLSFQINDVSISETMKAAFVLDAMPVSAAFQSKLLNDKVAEHLECDVWGAILYHGQSNLLRIESNLNSKR